MNVIQNKTRSSCPFSNNAGDFPLFFLLSLFSGLLPPDPLQLECWCTPWPSVPICLLPGLICSNLLALRMASVLTTPKFTSPAQTSPPNSHLKYPLYRASYGSLMSKRHVQLNLKAEFLIVPLNTNLIPQSSPTQRRVSPSFQIAKVKNLGVILFFYFF